MKRVSFYTFGCRLNQSETASIQNSLESGGYKVVDFGRPADIVVVNTCTVTEGGDADTRRLVNRVNRLIPAARIALVGCQAQMQKGQLASLKNVRWIVGNQRKMELGRVFDEYPDPEVPAVVAGAIEKGAFTLSVAAVDRDHTRANLKVQDGCDFFCSFCEIPYARGRARSRVLDDILLEAKALAAAGHRELVLTGINIGTYAYNGKGLMHMLDALEKVEGIERVRISSIEPTTIPEGLLERMGEGKLCPYLHIPLQSGHNDILAAMKRKYSVEDFTAFASRAKSRVPGLCIGTDVIVGFPGEEDVHFEASVSVIREAPIDYCHVFSYSPRSMAKSNALAPVPTAVITQRSRLLRELSGRKRRLFHAALLETVRPVLFESCKDGVWSGLTDNYVRVRVPGAGLGDLSNRIQLVSLKGLEGQVMTGEMLC